jgi:hypothetical protein
MDRVAVKSSNVKAVGYDRKKHILEIEFLNDTLYNYKPISESQFIDFILAPSKGKWIHENLRNNDAIKVTKIFKPDDKPKK